MSVIDLHAHAFPDSLAKRAIAQLESGCPWKAVGDGTTSGLLKSMDAVGIDVAVVCMIATKPDQAENILGFCRKIRSDRIEPLPSLHPDTADPEKLVAKFVDENFVGVKLHPMYQSFAVDDPKLDRIYAPLAESGLFVEFHCGRDIAFPPDDDRAAPMRLADVNRRFPKLRIVCTHMGGWQMWDEAEKHIVGRDVILETSFSLGDRGASEDRIAQLIRKHGVQRVCFGSDWPWSSQADDLARVRALPLDAKDIQRICWSNAARLLGY